MIDKILSIIVNTILTLLVLLVFLIVYASVSTETRRTEQAKEIAAQQGCKYVGYISSKGSFRAIDCKGTIKIIQVE